MRIALHVTLWVALCATPLLGGRCGVGDHTPARRQEAVRAAADRHLGPTRHFAFFAFFSSGFAVATRWSFARK